MMKKAISRTVVLAVALCLLMGTALAASVGLMDFLYTNDTGTVQIAAPEVVRKAADRVQMDVREAACDGMVAHVVVAYKLEDMKLVWDVHYDSVSEAQKEKTALFQEHQAIEVNGEKVFSYGFDYRYEDDHTIVADYLIDLRGISRKLGDQLQISAGMRMMNLQWETLEDCSFEVLVPVQHDDWPVYEAVNLPCEQNNYRLLSAQLMRTDIGCYLTIEAEDTVSAAEMEPYAEDHAAMVSRYPMHGQFGVMLLDEKGGEYRNLYTLTRHLNESDVETIVHLQTETICQKFDVGNTLVIQPICEGYGDELIPITLEMKKK